MIAVRYFIKVLLKDKKSESYVTIMYNQYSTI